jgi:hypothetical protein
MLNQKRNSFNFAPPIPTDDIITEHVCTRSLTYSSSVREQNPLEIPDTPKVRFICHRESIILKQAVTKVLCRNGAYEVHTTSIVQTSRCIPYPLYEGVIKSHDDGEPWTWHVASTIVLQLSVVYNAWPKIGWPRHDGGTGSAVPHPAHQRYYVYRLRSVTIWERTPCVCRTSLS